MSDIFPTILRKWCNEIRRCPAPIADAVPMVQQAAAEIERLRGLLREARNMIDGSMNHYIGHAPDRLVKRIDAALSGAAQQSEVDRG